MGNWTCLHVCAHRARWLAVTHIHTVTHTVTKRTHQESVCATQQTLESEKKKLDILVDLPQPIQLAKFCVLHDSMCVHCPIDLCLYAQNPAATHTGSYLIVRNVYQNAILGVTCFHYSRECHTFLHMHFAICSLESTASARPRRPPLTRSTTTARARRNTSLALRSSCATCLAAHVRSPVALAPLASRPLPLRHEPQRVPP